MAPALMPPGGNLVDMEFLFVCIAFFVGGGVGFFIAALMAIAARDDECARCLERGVEDRRPRNGSGHAA